MFNLNSHLGSFHNMAEEMVLKLLKPMGFVGI